MESNSVVCWCHRAVRNIPFLATARVIAILCFTLTLLGCASPWSIARVSINPAGPLGGVNAINPVVLIAPEAGSPGGFQAVETTVQFKREPSFNGNIHSIVTLFLYPPGANSHFSVIRLRSATAGSSRTEGIVFNAFCRRVNQANGQTSVELFVQTAAGSGGSATVSGVAHASTEAEIEVASRTDTANPDDWPVQVRGLRVPITCLRDDPAAPRPPRPPPPELTPRQKCLSDCAQERNACMASVPERDGPRPQQCALELRGCQSRCPP